MRYAVLLGRILFSSIFILSGPKHFQPQDWAYAASFGVSKGLVELAGIDPSFDALYKLW